MARISKETKRLQTKAMQIAIILEQMYPDAICTLDHMSPLQLLVATQLAAQSTDARVNIVTKTLFQKYRSVQDYANADLSELEQDIYTTGFYHNKAKNLKACALRMITAFGGDVPSNMEDLISLPGVGRKTANVVLGTCFGVPGVIVDTHATRLANRMGLVSSQDAVKIEKSLMQLLPKERWTMFSHRLVAHGRAICDARKPKCSICAVLPYCDFGQKPIE